MSTWYFRIVTRDDPQSLIRMLNFFSQLGLTPRRVSAVESNSLVAIHIEQSGLGEHQAHIIAEKMRSSLLVEDVRIRHRRGIVDRGR